MTPAPDPPPSPDGHPGHARARIDELDLAYAELMEQTPDRVTRMILWLRRPEERWVRMPLGLLLICGGALWFLPVLGLEMLPAGLLLIAQDVPPLRRPVGRWMLWLIHRWIKMMRWMRQKF